MFIKAYHCSYNDIFRVLSHEPCLLPYSVFAKGCIQWVGRYYGRRKYRDNIGYTTIMVVMVTYNSIIITCTTKHKKKKC